MKSANPNAKLHTGVTNYLQILGLKNDNIGLSAYFQNVKLNNVSADVHGIEQDVNIPHIFSNVDPRFPSAWISSSSNEYNNQLPGKVFGNRNSITPEEETPGPNDPTHTGSLIYQVELARSQRDLYSPNTQFLMLPQIHVDLFKKQSQNFFERGLSEPTNEEIQAQAMVSNSSFDMMRHLKQSY